MTQQNPRAAIVQLQFHRKGGAVRASLLNPRRADMKTSLLIAVAVIVGLGTSTVPTFAPVVYADGLVAEGKEAMKGTGKSLTEATGKLKTDATQTSKTRI